MGKASYSPLGQWRKKVGGQVYRIDGGEQIVSAYQPIVNNPKTGAQMSQRARFTLATKYTSALGSWAYDINKYDIASNRKRRGYVLAKVLEGTDSTEGGAGAVLNVSEINGKLVKSPSAFVSVELGNPTLTDNVATWDITAEVINIADLTLDDISYVQAIVSFVNGNEEGVLANAGGQAVVNMSFLQGKWKGTIESFLLEQNSTCIANAVVRVHLTAAALLRYSQNLSSNSAGSVSLGGILRETGNYLQSTNVARGVINPGA